MPSPYAATCGGLVVCLLSLTGCSQGPTMAEVSGSVTFDGKELETGSIAFRPADGNGPTAGAAIEKGKYATRVPLGSMTVVINAPKVVSKRKAYPDPKSPWIEEAVELLPEKYNAKTTLTYEVVAGKNEKDFALSK